MGDNVTTGLRATSRPHVTNELAFVLLWREYRENGSCGRKWQTHGAMRTISVASVVCGVTQLFLIPHDLNFRSQAHAIREHRTTFGFAHMHDRRTVHGT